MKLAGGAALLVAAGTSALCGFRAVRQGMWATTDVTALPFEVEGCRVWDVRARIGGVGGPATVELRSSGEGRVLGRTVFRGVAARDVVPIRVLAPASGDPACFDLVIRPEGGTGLELRRELRFGGGAPR